MTSWILSIVGVICLGVLLEIVLPDGQTSKYVKGAFSLLVIFVVAAPLPKLLGSSGNWTLSGENIGIDESFVTDTAAMFAKDTETGIEDYLLVSGYTAKVKITIKEGTASEIERVDVELSVSVLDSEETNKHITRVRELVAKRTGAGENIIFVTVTIEGDDDGGSN